jgi:TolB-like protein/tetratricopeptide (TPR) repeat protein
MYRTTSGRRVPTAERKAFSVARPWWRRPAVLAGVGVGVVALAAGLWLTFGKGGGPSGIADLARARQLAVLYFAAPAGDAELQSMADRITESVIQSLGAIPELSVRSADAVAGFGRSFSDSVATALEVGTVVTGSVEATGERVRISTTLREAASGAPISTETTDVPRDSLFRAEDAVAAEVARSLRQVIGSDISVRTSRSGTANLAAWTALQRAEKFRKEATGADSAQARRLLGDADSLLRQATAADPRWIEPMVLLGNVALDRGRIEPPGASKQRYYTEGLEHAAAALRLNPRYAKALELRGTLRYALWATNAAPTEAARQALLDDAEQDLLAAVTADPGLASARLMLSQLYYDKQDVAEAHNQASKAYDADRYLADAPLVINRLFYTAYDTRSFTQAAKWCDEGARRFPRDFQFALCGLWLMLVPDAPRDPARAWQLAARVDSLAPPASRLFYSHLAQLIVGGAIGKVIGGVQSPLLDSAQRVLERARLPARDDPTHELQGFEAVMLVQMGQYAEALRLMTRYVASNPDHSFRVGGDVHWWWEPLRQRPEFQRLLAAQNP